MARSRAEIGRRALQAKRWPRADPNACLHRAALQRSTSGAAVAGSTLDPRGHSPSSAARSASGRHLATGRCKREPLQARAWVRAGPNSGLQRPPPKRSIGRRALPAKRWTRAGPKVRLQRAALQRSALEVVVAGSTLGPRGPSPSPAASVLIAPPCHRTLQSRTSGAPALRLRFG